MAGQCFYAVLSEEMSFKYIYRASKADKETSAATVRALSEAMTAAWGFPAMYKEGETFNVFQWRCAKHGVDVTREWVPPRDKPPSDKQFPKYANPYTSKKPR